MSSVLLLINHKLDPGQSESPCLRAALPPGDRPLLSSAPRDKGCRFPCVVGTVSLGEGRGHSVVGTVPLRSPHP